jgi:uncharacterized protein
MHPVSACRYAGRRFPVFYRKPTHRGPVPRVSALQFHAGSAGSKNKPHIVRGVQLSGLFIYPIKACAGIALQQADVVERGLAFDRRYMLVDRSGTFITQREMPRLCRVATALDGERLLVSTPGQATLELPREPASDLPLSPSSLNHQSSPLLKRQPYRVWDSVGSALEHPSGSRWFSEFLNDEVSLLYMPDSERRDVNPNRARPGDIVSFADSYPFLLMSEASLADLNQRLVEPVEMRRFRPNLVFSGSEPYAEDGFATLRIGGLSFRGVKRCERCVVTTINPDTAVSSQEPLRTLSHYRLDDGKVWFGMNLIHDGCGTLRLGDAVIA